MLNLIRCVAICFVALFLSACTTIEAKRGFAVKTFGYEFTCAHEPGQTVIDGDVVKKLVEATSGQFAVQKIPKRPEVPEGAHELSGRKVTENGVSEEVAQQIAKQVDEQVAQREYVTKIVAEVFEANAASRTNDLFEKCKDLTKQKLRFWEKQEKQEKQEK